MAQVLSCWIKWSGGLCPVDGRKLVTVRFRDATIAEIRAPAALLDWGHANDDLDIVAYAEVAA